MIAAGRAVSPRARRWCTADDDHAALGGMVIAWPMPISRSRDSTTPAMVIDRQQKNAERGVGR